MDNLERCVVPLKLSFLCPLKSRQSVMTTTHFKCRKPVLLLSAGMYVVWPHKCVFIRQY